MKSSLKQFLGSLEPGEPFRRDEKGKSTPLIFQSRLGQDLDFLTIRKPKDGWVPIGLLVAPANEWAFSLAPSGLAQATFMPDSEDEIVYTQISCVDLHELLRQRFPKHADTLIRSLGHEPN